MGCSDVPEVGEAAEAMQALFAEQSLRQLPRVPHWGLTVPVCLDVPTSPHLLRTAGD